MAHCGAGLGPAMLFSGLCSLPIHTLLDLQQASHRGEVKNTFSEHIAPNRGDWVSAYWDKQIEYAILITLFSKGKFSSGSCHPINILCPGLTFHPLYFASPSGISGGDKLTIDHTMLSRGQILYLNVLLIKTPLLFIACFLLGTLRPGFPPWLRAESSCPQLPAAWGTLRNPRLPSKNCNVILEKSSARCFHCVAIGLQKTVMAQFQVLTSSSLWFCLCPGLCMQQHVLVGF